MKIIWALVCLLLLGISCKKTSGDSNPSFSFVANGTHFEWNGNLKTETMANPGASFMEKGSYCLLYATPDFGSPFVQNSFISSYFVIPFSKDTTPVPGTYSTSVFGNATGLTPWLTLAADRCSFPGTYTADNLGDTTMTVTITSVSNGFVSGTFSGLLRPNIRITDGRFNQVPVIP
jgi:hypothetical protein